MPLYNYQCVECSTPIELYRKMKDRNKKVECVECGSLCEKVIAVSFVPLVWDSDKEYHNFDTKPVRFKTQDDMRRKCREQGVECGKLL